MDTGQPGSGRVFYLVNGGTDTRDSSLRLRIEWHERYNFAFNERGEGYHPLVATLPRGRGFLAGATLGEGMASFIDTDAIYKDDAEAFSAAMSTAEYAAFEQREYEEQESARLEAEELREENIDLIKQVRILHAERRQFLKKHGDRFAALYEAVRSSIHNTMRQIERNTERLADMEG